MIADYDKYNYDYSNYWEDRSYEHKAEVNVLKKLLTGKGDIFLDIGGSFGRHAPLYAERYKHPIIVDYSLKTLQKNREEIQKRFPNVELIAANAYKLPFRESSVDAGMMIRVLHHIDRPEEYFAELKRALKPSGEYIQEFANKYHIKARLRALLKGNWDFFNLTPYQQPTAENFEGTEGEETVFLNYHPKYIRHLFNTLGFTVVSKKGSSFLRMPVLKKLLPEKILLLLEKIAQSLLSWSNIPPSVFLKVIARKDGEPVDANSVESILVCPECKSDLVMKGEQYLCNKCSAKYAKKEGIWDFRVE